MKFPIEKLESSQIPALLKEIPEPPKQLYYRGNLPPADLKYCAVVGSRNYTTYGKQVTENLLQNLKGYNIGIISGLALGIDGIAHTAALAANLYTLSVPGSGIDESILYPQRHRVLANQILESGGCLLSEYEPTFKATTWSFPRRNRIMAGLAQAVLVIEATQKSGTLITSRLATEYNRDVLTVPGNIFSPHSDGPHMLIKLGATPVTSSDDIIEALNLTQIKQTKQPSLPSIDMSPQEKLVFEQLSEPCERDTLVRSIDLPTQEVNTLLSLMEINGLIVIEQNVIRRTI